MNSNTFADLPLKPELLEALSRQSFSEMTPIQAQSLPLILAGQDVIAQARTGSGKTAAFALGILNKVDTQKGYPQALILCPTRELADQVASSVRQLGSTLPNLKVVTLCGGVPSGPQRAALEHGSHVVVGTPGRVLDHLSKGRLMLDRAKIGVLDEADRMLDMGFSDDLDAILAACPRSQQRLFFSATYDDNMKALAKAKLQNAAVVHSDDGEPVATIESHFYQNNGQSVFTAATQLIAHFAPQSLILFCNTKVDVEQTRADLARAGYSIAALHGDMEQRERDLTLACFANRSYAALVATDVAARGLDIPDVDLVLNLDMARDVETHTHRIGRTGRAGKSGVAVTLVSKGDQYKFKRWVDDGLMAALEPMPEVAKASVKPIKAPMQTLQIAGGKKQKLRKGDILGALTRDGAIAGSAVGAINSYEQHSLVAIASAQARAALQQLTTRPIKGKMFKARLI